MVSFTSNDYQPNLFNCNNTQISSQAKEQNLNDNNLINFNILKQSKTTNDKNYDFITFRGLFFDDQNDLIAIKKSPEHRSILNDFLLSKIFFKLKKFKL